MSCGDSGTNRPLQFRFPASDYVPPVPEAIADAPTRDYLLDLRKQLTRVFDATRTVTQDIQAPVVLQVNRALDQSLSAGVATKVQFDTVRYDTHSYWSPTNHRFNPRIAGFYRISWSVVFGPEAGGNNLCTAQMVVSGRDDVKAQARNSSTTQNVTAATSTNLYLDGDTDVYIEIYATSAAAADIIGDPALTFLAVDYVGDIHVGALSGENSASTNALIRINTDNDSVYGNAPLVGELVRAYSWTPPLTALAGTTTGNSLCAVPNGGNVDIVTWVISGAPYTTFDYDAFTYDYAGNLLATTSASDATLGSSSGCSLNGGSNSYIAHMRRGGIGEVPESGGWFRAGANVTGTIGGPTQDGYNAVDSAPCVMGGKVYAVSGDGHVTSWLLTAGDPASGHTDSYALTGLANGHSGSAVVAGDDGYLYVVAPDPDNTNFNALYRFSANLSLVTLWHCAAVAPSNPAPAKLKFDFAFGVYRGYLICSNQELGVGYYYVYKFNDDGTITQVSRFDPNAGAQTYEVISLGNGFFVTRDGVVRLT